MEHLQIIRILGVQRNGALVAVIGLVMGRIQAALEGPKRIAGVRSLHLDDIGAEISQMHACSRTGDIGAQFDDTNVFQDFDHAGCPRPRLSRYCVSTACHHR